MTIETMTPKYAKQIIAWQYPPPYDFYNFAVIIQPDVYQELLAGDYFAVLSKEDNTLLGFYAFGLFCRISTPPDSTAYSGNALDFGLGMHPDYTGQGQGYAFVTKGKAFAKERFHPYRLRLSVADFNLRAIAVYKRAGFQTFDRVWHPELRETFLIMQTPPLISSENL